MKFNLVAVSALVATATAAAPNAASTTSVLSPQASCVVSCPLDDVCCKAACMNVPCPSKGDANDTTECAAKCNQGKGSPADIKAFADCQQACIKDHFFTGNANGPVPTNPGKKASDNPSATDSSDTSAATDGSDNNNNNNNSNNSGSATGTQTGDETSTETGSSSTSTAGAANLQVGASTAGVLGLILAALAL